MKTIIGQWANAGGGTLHLELSKYALVGGSTQNAPRYYHITLDDNGAIPAGYEIWCNDEIMPEGTSYKRIVFDSYGYIIFGPEQVWICGTAPISLTPETTGTLKPQPPLPPGPPEPPPSTTIMITPGSASLQPGQVQQFTSNMSVIWSASDGQISSAGLYTAPSVTSAATVTITATSLSDPTNITQITISVQPVAQIVVTVAPNGGSLTQSQTLQFSAVASNTLNQNFTWTASSGTITSPGGLYTAPSTITVASTASITATSVADSTKSASVTVSLQPPISTGQIDLLTWTTLDSRSTQHLAGDASAPYAVTVLDTDAIYPAGFPTGLVWFVKNKLGNPWDINTYDQNYISHWITENGDSVDQAACQAANGTSCWLYARAYKRYLNPVHVLPRYFTPGSTITLDNPSPNDVNRTTNCESTYTVVHIGDVRGITTGPFKISWGGSIDHGSGTLANGPNYDSVNGVDTIKNQYMYSGTIASGNFADVEEYYFVKGFGRVAWYYYHNGAFVQKTVNTTLASGGAPTPNFPCGAGKSWWV